MLTHRPVPEVPVILGVDRGGEGREDDGSESCAPASTVSSCPTATTAGGLANLTDDVVLAERVFLIESVLFTEAPDKVRGSTV
mmetsp:Transcript_49160/g.72087  ORF Transcript_49160/g.72087 Transcript_49160/m.72087 type:complete len:83 (+) Transcript_49160:605-853(+)